MGQGRAVDGVSRANDADARPTRESVAVVKESLTPAPAVVAETVDPDTGEVTEPDGLDELFRATMRDTNGGAPDGSGAAVGPSGGSVPPASAISGSESAVLPHAPRVDAPLVNEGLVIPPPAVSYTHLTLPTNREV